MTVADVQATTAVLQTLGIDQPVRRLVAATLTPAEGWALAAYAAAKRWRTPLLIGQVYDKTTKQPRPAFDLAAEHDEVGTLLAAQPVAVAAGLVALVAAHCPDQPGTLLAAPLVAENPAAQPALLALWDMVATLRQAAGRPLVAGAAPTSDEPLSHTWQQVLALVQSQMSAAEFLTWLQPTELLAVEPGCVVVGTPNIFVRQEIESCYQALLEAAATTVLDRAVTAEVVIAAPQTFGRSS